MHVYINSVIPSFCKQKKYISVGFLFFIYFISLFACTNYNLNQKNISNLERKAGFKNWMNYSIRKKPITNREYLIFLGWSISVYGDSYPSYVAKLIPDRTEMSSPVTKENILYDITNPSNPLQQYVFNINFLDYPVTGLSLFQVTHLYQWMTDRYAENKLIFAGYLNSNLEQRDESSFSLEAHLVGQYQGDVRKGPRRSLEDKFFIPAFRPPVDREKKYVRERNRKGNVLKIWRTYKMTKHDFLWIWNKEYLVEVEDEIALRIGVKSYPLINEEQFVTYKDYKHVFHVKDRKSFFSNTKYIDEAKGILKNEFGKMPFSYVGKNAYGRPIIRDNSSTSNKIVSNPILSFYWLAFDTVIENVYWPNTEGR